MDRIRPSEITPEIKMYREVYRFIELDRVQLTKASFIKRKVRLIAYCLIKNFSRQMIK